MFPVTSVYVGENKNLCKRKFNGKKNSVVSFLYFFSKPKLKNKPLGKSIKRKLRIYANLLSTKLPNTFREAISKGILGYQKFFSEHPETPHISFEV